MEKRREDRCEVLFRGPVLQLENSWSSAVFLISQANCEQHSSHRSVQASPLTIQPFETVPETRQYRLVRRNGRERLTIPQRRRIAVIDHVNFECTRLPERLRKVLMHSLDQHGTAGCPYSLKKLSQGKRIVRTPTVCYVQIWHSRCAIH